MPHLTTHVLDAATGTPAAGIAVSLATVDGDAVGTAVTDADGRAGLGPELLDAGDYTIRFETGPYFAAAGVDAFYPDSSSSGTTTWAATGVPSGPTVASASPSLPRICTGMSPVPMASGCTSAAAAGPRIAS